MNTTALRRESPSKGAANKPSGREEQQLGGTSETIKALLLAGLPLLIFLWGRHWYDESYYKAEEGVGYWLGLSGGVLMLLAYGYSLRKHIPGFRQISSLGKWLRIHIVFGIVGPFLILPHTTFRFESLNGTIAFISMSAVFLSGVVGRYLYSKVHFGLTGKKAELRELTQHLGLYDKDRLSVLAAIEPVRERLVHYERIVMSQQYGFIPALRTLVTTRVGGYTLYWALSRELRRYLMPLAQQQRWNAADLDAAERQTRALLKSFLEAMIEVSKFKAYDQLFVLWRMVHVPLLFLLLISGVLHVIAVHMY
jgi:hypothetical protein